MADVDEAKVCAAGIGTKRCPNPECANSRTAGRGFYVKKGYFKTKWNAQPVPRYRCRGCGKGFSSHTRRATYGQRRPELNDTVFRLYASGMTQRRMAVVLRVNRKTIVRKFLFVARLAREAHERHIARGELVTSHAQFDEMETFEHTRLKPVSLAIAVRAKTGHILDIRCAVKAYNGPLAAQARAKYGPRPDLTSEAVKDVLGTVRHCSPQLLALTTDADPRYLNQVRRELPHAVHRSIKRCFEKTDRKNKNDHLFTLNYTAAKLRNDLSRLARKTWVTTKRIDRLQAHLDLYIAYNNGYRLAA